MEKAVSYTKNTGLGVVAMLALFAAAGVVGVILNMTTWEQLGDWMAKAALLGLVLVVVGAIAGMIAGAVAGSGEKK